MIRTGGRIIRVRRHDTRSQTFNERLAMFLVGILIVAGLYVCIKREVQASSTLVIRGKPALRIGIALLLGGVLAISLPAVVYAVGFLRGSESRYILPIIIILSSAVYAAVIVVAEKRRQANEKDKEGEVEKKDVEPPLVGPACVACGKPTPEDSEICPSCGWTQPR